MFLKVLDVNAEFGRTKGRDTWRLFKGKSTNQVDKLDSPDSTVKNTAQPQLAVPLVEALFLPDFPVKSSDTDFDVSTVNSPLIRMVWKRQF